MPGRLQIEKTEVQIVHQLGVGFLQTTTEAGERRYAVELIEPISVRVERAEEGIDLTPNKQMQGLDLIKITLEGPHINGGSGSIWLVASKQTASDLAKLILAVVDGSVTVVEAQL